MAFTINQKVRDFNTGDPLPFATVMVVNSDGTPFYGNNNTTPIGRKTDIDGSFVLPIAFEHTHIKVTYVGYTTLIHPATDYKHDDIYLSPSKTSLSEVIIYAGKEPVEVKDPVTNEKKIIYVPSPEKKSKAWLIVGGVVALSTLITLVILKYRK